MALALLVLPVAGQAPQDEPQVVQLSDALVLDPVGRRTRAAIYTDALQLRLLDGDWATPAAGDTVNGPDGAERAWRPARAAEDGWLRDAALRGGYALFTHDSAQERVMLLDARGHSGAWVNGELRAGNPYGTGFVRLPVHLREGANTFLFAVSRGEVWARLVEPRSQAMLEPGDTTLPDVIAGETEPLLGAIVVLNVTTSARRALRLEVRDPRGGSTSSPLPPVPALSLRKVPFTVPAPPPDPSGPWTLRLRLVEPDDGPDQEVGEGQRVLHDETELELRVREPGDHHDRTFLSAIDGSVQYYSVRPASPEPGAGSDPDEAPALVLSLHGASVPARRQAGCYRARAWCHVVAPTNRRPFGFDWEDWGRLDALEALAAAARRFGADPRRTCVTGHSMGGHGTWHLGASFPDRFAAVAPSAGWVSFWSYGGAPSYDDSGPLERMLARARAPSDTLAISANLMHQGVYVLHGDRDDNVPVSQARTMREHLATFHADFAYYERPGAGHWWGNECMDWPPLFEFLRGREIPESRTVRHVRFLTASPGVSSSCHWAAIEAQERAGVISGIDLRLEPEGPAVRGTTDNVRRLRLDLDLALERPAGDAALTIELDGDTVRAPWPAAGSAVHFARRGGTWQAIGPPDPALKGPHRCGPFKDAFRHRFVLVYGTAGDERENAWARAKARADAETFWYRGNGAADVVADAELDLEATADRSVILYGNAETNTAWGPLLADSPVQVARGAVTVGGHRLAGDDLACLLVRPRPGSDVASVAVVGGSGVRGMRLTDRLPYFVSGVAYPDVIVIGPEMLTRGAEGIRAAGFFGEDWSVESGEIEFREGGMNRR